jgi:hypothetical protein
VTIRRGEEWGVAVERPEPLTIARSDAELAGLVADGPPGAVALGGGDLFRAVGEPAPRPIMQRVPVDLLRVRLDGRDLVAVAHVVACRAWWCGPVVTVMNVDHLGSWNVAPRAHPNDGRFDVVEVDPSMSVRQRWQARRRLPSGTHVPHPAISTSTGAVREWVFDRPVRVWVDGQPAGRSRSLAVAIEPDAFELHV